MTRIDSEPDFHCLMLHSQWSKVHAEDIVNAQNNPQVQMYSFKVRTWCAVLVTYIINHCFSVKGVRLWWLSYHLYRLCIHYFTPLVYLPNMCLNCYFHCACCSKELWSYRIREPKRPWQTDTTGLNWSYRWWCGLQFWMHWKCICYEGCTGMLPQGKHSRCNIWFFSCLSAIWSEISFFFHWP